MGGIVTALRENPELAGEAYRTGKGLPESIREMKILTDEQIKELLDPVNLIGLDPTRYPSNK